MAVNFPSGFNMSHNEPVDNRLVLTKAQMVSMRTTKMPKVYLSICSDDGQLYLYNSSNSTDPTTGKFRIFQAGDVEAITEQVIQNIDTEKIVENMDTSVITEEVIENLDTIPMSSIQTLFQKEENTNG